MPFSLYLQQSAVSNAQLKQYASTAQLFDMVKWTKEAYNHFGVPYFDTCCQAEPFNIDLYISDDAGNMMSLGADGKLTVSVVTIAANLVSAQAGNNIIVSTFDNKLWAPQVSGMVYATGTTNYIAKFQGTTSLIDSTLFEYITASGTTVVVNGTTAQKVVMQDNAVTASLLFPNLTTSSPSGYSAIASQVLDGTRNRRIAQFLNDTLSLWGHSVTTSSGSSPTYGIWQDINRVFSIRSNGNVMIRTSNTTSDFNDTGYKLDVFGSFRTNSTVNFTGVANTTAADVLYYDSATGAVTYGTTPSVTLNSSGTAPYYMLMYDTANNLVKSTQLWTGSSQQTLLLDGAPSSVTGASYPQPLIIRQYSDYTGSNPSLYPGFDVYNLQPGGAGTNGIGAGLNFRTYYKGGYAGIYSQSLSDSNSNLRFYVTNAGAKSEAIHISSNTYVGIGTSAPSEQLHVSGNAKITGVLNLAPQSSNPLSGNIGDIYLYNSGATWQLRVCTSTSPLIWTAL
jgi:hypothetical protein